MGGGKRMAGQWRAARTRAVAAAAAALVAGLVVSGGPASAAPAGPAHHQAAARALASGWQVQNTPNPPARTGALVADSCASATACMAVGSYQPDGVFFVPLAEAWDGAVWSVQKPPVPADAQTTNLLGVSCVSVSHCVAVGNYRNKAGNIVTLAEAWNGTAWSIQATPNPAGNQVSVLTSVSCSAVNACTAVGYSGDFGGLDSVLTLAEAWNGTSWSIQPTSNPTSPNHAYLTGVSCTAPSACIAVGSADGFEPVAEAWNGTSWSLQKPPNPAGAIGGVLAGVSCTSASACAAVGNYQNRSGAHALLAEAWNGTAWAIEPAAKPAGASRSYLNGVSCLSATACTAVGSYQSGKLTHVPLAEVWNGSAWSIRAIPGPAAPRSSLAGVACRSASVCVAVGSQTSRYQAPTPLAEAWNGASWSIETTPAPATFPQNSLSAVACPAATDCFAVGSSGVGAGSGALTEHWNGSSWSIQRTPVTGGFQNYLGGLACTSATACTAVGGMFTRHGGHALAERWNGTTWSVQRIPSEPHPSNSFLLAVSCASPGSCVAVGDAQHEPAAVPMAEVWNGTSWSIRTPIADGPGDSGLDAVSCTSPSSCIAVGFGNNSTTEVPIAERWNGTSWSAQPVPVPAGLFRGFLTGVSCAAAGGCIAVGNYEDSSGNGFPLAESWDGTAWSVQPISGPAGSQGTPLSSVSCTSPSTCTAVGNYTTRAGAVLLLAEVWNGTSWSSQPVAGPKNVVSSFLSGVACGAPGVCTAVGSSTTKIDNQGASANKTLAAAEPNRAGPVRGRSG